MDNIIGNSDPSKANSKSIRGQAYSNYKEYGLLSQPSHLNNIIHASASAFEGMVERLIWVNGTVIFTDLFGCKLSALRIPISIIRDWARYNPIVQEKFLFEHLNRMDSDSCIAKCEKLYKIEGSKFYFLFLYTYINILLLLL
jgi:hypothetical protein